MKTLLVVILLLANLSSASAFSILSEAAQYKFDNQEILFSIEFDEIPDFHTVDEFNRGLNEFAYFISYNSLQFDFQHDIVITSQLIHSNNLIAIYEPGPFDRVLRGTAPFSLIDCSLSFSVPIALIGDPDNIFTYGLGLGMYGSGVGRSFFSRSTPAPEPATLVTFIAGAIGVLISKPKKFYQG